MSDNRPPTRGRRPVDEPHPTADSASPDAAPGTAADPITTRLQRRVLEACASGSLETAGPLIDQAVAAAKAERAAEDRARRLPPSRPTPNLSATLDRLIETATASQQQDERRQRAEAERAK